MNDMSGGLNFANLLLMAKGVTLLCGLVLATDLRAQTPNYGANPSCTEPQILSLFAPPNGQTGRYSAPSPEFGASINTVRSDSFPELRNKVIEVRYFKSPSDYFRIRFSISRFLLLRRMRYFVEINAGIFASGTLPKGVCAILAHELVHISRLSRGNRTRLFGLVRLVSRAFAARFERSTDFEAIRRGYGPGLIAYRQWIYQRISARALAQKRRNYLSPEEIETVLRIASARPELLAVWSRRAPVNLEEIKRSAAGSQD